MISQTDNAITFKNVTVSIRGNTILDSVTAHVPVGSCTAIVGPNGAGKTTMLLALLGEISYMGEICITHKLKLSNARLGYVPQFLPFDRGMPLTVLEFMVIDEQRMPIYFGIKRKHREHALELLSNVNSQNLLNRKLGTLSGGELQRVLLALALSHNPELLILDEPASGVDVHGEYIFCELLDKIRHKQGFTQLMVSHDLATVTHHASHVICLNKKVATEGKPQDVLTSETLTTIFGLHMGLVNKRALPSGSGNCSASCCHEDPS